MANSTKGQQSMGHQEPIVSQFITQALHSITLFDVFFQAAVSL
jgi:hypothetical protein